MMPNVSGQIEYTGFTLFLAVPMVELRQNPTVLHQMLANSMSHSVGITFDADAEGATDFVDMVVDCADEFMEHVMEVIPVGIPALGMIVWEGGATINAQKEVSFHGTVRRPTAEDFTLYGDIMTRIDADARDQALEHAKTCRRCAEKMGLDPSEVHEDESEDPDSRPHAVWFIRDVGEA